MLIRRFVTQTMTFAIDDSEVKRMLLHCSLGHQAFSSYVLSVLKTNLRKGNYKPLFAYIQQHIALPDDLQVMECAFLSIIYICTGVAYSLCTNRRRCFGPTKMYVFAILIARFTYLCPDSGHGAYPVLQGRRQREARVLIHQICRGAF